MSLLLSIVLWLLAVVLGVMLLVLLIPIHLQAVGAVDEDRLEGRALARWGWWLLTLRADPAVGIDARLCGLRVWRYHRRSEEPKKKKKVKERTGWWQRKEAGARAWRNRDGLSRVASTALRAMPLSGTVHATIGLSDPADTGALFGLLDQLAQWSEAIELDLEPNWIDETLELDGAIGVRLWPVQVLLALVWLLIRDGQARRGVRDWWRAS